MSREISIVKKNYRKREAFQKWFLDYLDQLPAEDIEDEVLIGYADAVRAHVIEECIREAPTYLPGANPGVERAIEQWKENLENLL